LRANRATAGGDGGTRRSLGKIARALIPLDERAALREYAPVFRNHSRAGR
jgi:hypothetical protein